MTLSDPAWKKVQVVVTNVTENINGTGGIKAQTSHLLLTCLCQQW